MKAQDLPRWIILLCGFTSLIAIIISGVAIYLQLCNYRKPFEQRLIVRILVIVPIFSISCYTTLVKYKIGTIIEPIREIYEAFVIYTFYKLLVLTLGGEKEIIQMTVDKPPTVLPFPISIFVKKVNISDPRHFLTIKRCILQYVWVKPLLYILIFITSMIGWYDVNDVSKDSVFVWIGIFYNISVTTSLFCLAMFWKCLYNELKVFNPWRKFLCVKLIIFASYWQGLIIGLLNWIGIFDEYKDINIDSDNREGNLGIQIQNGLLCFEMIFFAWLHWNSFPYNDFTADKLPDSARFKTWIAFKDCINVKDLIYDLRITTIYGDSYNLRKFDSVDDSRVFNSSETFNKKIYQGLRISGDGKKYWIGGAVRDGYNDNHNNDNGDNGDNGDNNDSNRRTDDKDDNNNNSGNNSNKSNNSINPLYERRFSTGRLSYGHNSTVDQHTPLLKNDKANPRKKYLSSLEDLIDHIDSEDGSNDNARETENSSLLSNNSNSNHNNNSNNNNSIASDGDSILFANEDFAKDEKVYRYVKNHFITEAQINYPVEYEYSSALYSSRITKMRKKLNEFRNDSDMC